MGGDLVGDEGGADVSEEDEVEAIAAAFLVVAHRIEERCWRDRCREAGRQAYVGHEGLDAIGEAAGITDHILGLLGVDLPPTTRS